MRAGLKCGQVFAVISHELITTDVVQVLIDAADLKLKAGRDSGIQDFLFRSQQQPLHHTALGDMGIQNLVNILTATIVVPRALRIDHHHRAEFATIKTAAFVNPDALTDLELLALSFHVFLQRH